MSQIFYNLSIELVRLELDIAIPTSNPIGFIIKVGSQTVTNQNELRFDQKDLDINESISLSIPMYQNKNHSYQQKIINIHILNQTNNLKNTIGKVKFDISHYVDQPNQRIYECLQIEKSQYKGKLSLYISCEQQTDGVEQNNQNRHMSKSPVSKTRMSKSPNINKSLLNGLTKSYIETNLTPTRSLINGQISKTHQKSDLKKVRTYLNPKETESRMKDQTEQLNIIMIQNGQLQNDLQDRKQENHKLQNDIELLDDQNKQQDGYIQVLQEQIKELQQEQKYDSQMERQEQLIKWIQQKLDIESSEEIMSRLDQWIVESQTKDQSINQLTNQINQLQSQISQLESSLDQQSTQTQYDIKIQQEHNRQQQIDHQNSVSQLKQQNNQNSDKIHKLEQQNEENVEQYLKTKQLLGDIINIIFEQGSESLMEKVEQKMF